jgi:hypothetical protein
MATTTTLTVDSATRNYEPRWHEKYHTELERGNSSVEVCELSDGDSIIRRQHDVIAKGAVEKHFESAEDIWTDANGEKRLVKINITVTLDVDSPEARTRADNLFNGYVAAFDANRISALLNGSLNR